MSAHTADLDHALAEALSRTEPYAEQIDIVASGLRADGTVAEYRVYAWRDGQAYTAFAPDVADAITEAMKFIGEACDGR